MERHSPTILVVVRDTRGHPLVGARVFFLEGPVSLPDIAALTDETGACSLSVPMAGNYRIRCVADDHEPTDVEKEIGTGCSQPVEVILSLATPLSS